ncbi:VOC family protein [Candidatus Acetothermia bacterium]|nr:VOC family protein [Candidatus Acetothermia bacterium]
MITQLSHVTVLVKDQDEALRFYTEKLGFEKKEDEAFGPGARWLTVSPKNQKDLEIVLWKPNAAMNGEEHAKKQLAQVGQSTHWVFATANCPKTYEELKGRGVKFVQSPEKRPYGTEAIFEDLYGNHFILVGPA